MGKKIDLTGKRFGKLTVIKDTGERNRSKKILYLCKCDCGNYTKVIAQELTSGGTRSCGCLKSEAGKKRYVNLVGKRFGKWTVIAETGKRNPTKFLCKCDCGKVCEVRSGDLINRSSEGCRKCANATHHMSKTRIYGIWNDMKSRCYNSNNKFYKHYGGRGISVCSEWKNSFEAFYEWATNNGYSEKLTIDRIDNNGIYEPNNCKWATWQEQRNNQRCAQYEINGLKKTLPEWCKYAGLKYGTVYQRIHKLGESIERALRLDEKQVSQHKDNC